MTDTPTIPGGAHPQPPAAVLWAPLYEDDRLLGALWAAVEPLPDGVNGGCTTHLLEVPPRLAWLAQNVVNGTRSGMAAADVLEEVRGMSNVRWRMGSAQHADSLELARGALYQLAAPPVEPPADDPHAAEPPADDDAEPVAPQQAEAKPAKAAKPASKKASPKEAPHAD
jgi:hypothetical protein